MQNLIPQFILEKHAKGEFSGQLEVISLFVDISGFSTVTSTLAQHGSEAAEVMADMMSRVFEPMVDAVYTHCGFITTFAGDGFTALFPEQEIGLEPSNHIQALAAALAIQAHMTSHPVQETPFGHFPFSVKLGIGGGKVDWGILQPDGENMKSAYYFNGPGIDSAAAAEHHAQPGNIIFSQQAAARLDGKARFLSVGDGGYVRLLAVTEDLPLPRVVELLPPQALPGEANFVPAAILERGKSGDFMELGNGEFRQVVSVFINLMSVRGREDLLPFIHAVFTLQRQYGGYLARVDFGDKGCNLLLFWGTPISTEKDLESALHFTLALGEYTPGSYKAGITYRMMYAGLAGSARRGEWTCYGEGVNYAARLMVDAPWGAIWLDERVANRSGGQFVIEKIGDRKFKGFAEPQPIYALLEQSQNDAAVFYQGKLIGRQDELARLHEFVRSIVTPGEVRFAGILVVEGDVGLGKSRLLAEFRAQVTAQVAEGQPGGLQWAFCQADQTVHAPLNPFRYWLRSYFKHSPAESAARNKRSFGRVLDQLIAATQDEVLQQELNRGRSFLGALLELYWENSAYAQTDPQGRYELTFTALKALILAESLRQPLVLNLEDAQFLDEDSRAFLLRLVRDVEAYPLAILASARPRSGQTPLFGSLPYDRLDLGIISDADMRTLAQELLNGPLDDELADLLAERAEGNPFFAEQILLYLREGGAIKEAGGKWMLANNRSRGELPTDVRMVFTARLDRLVREVKDIVQTGAVLGREFDVQVLSLMMRSDPQLSEKMRSAEDDGIWQALNQVRYLFKHALLRDAAYEMQLRSQRRELHCLAAQSLEQLYAQELELHYDEIAYHYEAAFQQGLEATRKPAYQYLERAGQRSMQAYENAAALDTFSRAMQLLSPEDEVERFNLLLQREAVLNLMGDRASQLTDLQEAQALADAWQRPAERAEIALRQANYANSTGKYDDAVEQARIASAAAQAAGQVKQEASAQLAWGDALYRKASYGESIEHLEQARVLAQAAMKPDLEASILLIAGNVALNQGRYDEADQYYSQALALSQQAGARRSEGSAWVTLGNLALRQANYPLARQRYLQGLEILRQVGDRTSEGRTLNNLGQSAKRQGDYDTAHKDYLQGLQITRQVGDRRMESMLLSNLGDVLADSGEYEAARGYYIQGLEIARQVGNRQSEGIGLGSLGIVAHHLGDYTTARDYLEQSLALFRQIGNRWAEAVGLIHLGEVALTQGDAATAQQHYTQSLELATQLNDRQRQGEAYSGLGQVAFLQEDYSAAEQYFTQSLDLARQVGDRRAEGKTLYSLGEVAAISGRLESSRAYYQEALALHQGLSQPQFVAADLAGLAVLAWKVGAQNESRDYLESLLPILAEHPGLEGTQHPNRVILEVVHLLDGLGDGRAAAILSDTQAHLRKQADRLPDEAARHLFLETIAENRELMAAVCRQPEAAQTITAGSPQIQVETGGPNETPTPSVESTPGTQPAPNSTDQEAQKSYTIKNLDQAGLSRLLADLARGGSSGAVIVINIENVNVENIYISDSKPKQGDK